MPNWVTTTLTVTGPRDQLIALRDKARSAPPDPEEGSEARVFTFSAFIPRPSSLSVESSSVGDNGFDVFFNPDPSAWKSVGWLAAIAQTREAAQLYLDLTSPEARKLAAIYHNNLVNYGCKTWYDWNTRFWGTKWDACHCDIDERLDENDPSPCLIYYFDTAWSPAEPVLEAMSEEFPLLEFNATFDEEGGFFYYRGTWMGGEQIEYEDLMSTRENEDDDTDADDDSDEDDDTEDEIGNNGPVAEIDF